MLLYVAIAIVVFVALIVLGRFIRLLWLGHRLATSMVTGEYDQSAIGQLFAQWFDERPARAEQRELFVQVSLGMGCRRGLVADRLIRCIRKVWDGARFGDLLAQEMDSFIVFDPPNTPEKARLQKIALEKFNELKARLRSLDETAD
jgi:hypothetical protein